jgi:hypothetical protein
MPVLLTEADYPTIRSAIRVDVDEKVVPDDVIGQDTYVGAAVREVKRIDPLADTRSGDPQMRLKLAAIYFAAARLCAGIAMPSSETFGNYKYTLADFDAEQRAGNLYWSGLIEIATVLGESAADLIALPSFGTPAGRRGDIGIFLATSPLADRTLGSGGSSVLGPF